MFGFSRRRGPESGPSTALGPLETRVMEILWSRGDCTVHGVVAHLEAGKLDAGKRAYTTVMTTLDRLFKKGLLERRKADRAFVYTPRYSRQQWENQRAGDLVARYLSAPQASGVELVSCLVEAVGRHDEALLDELENRIKQRRLDLARGRKP